MSYGRLALAAFGATVAYFLYGGVVFGALPILRQEFEKYPAVYRTQHAMMPVMPVGIAATFVAILVVAMLFAAAYPGRPTLSQGARFGALIGLFAVCGFVLHNYVNLNIGLKLTLEQAVAYFVEWTIVGIVISLIYRPRAAA